MTEERNPKSAEESTAAAFAVRERRKRRWDQPAESLLSAGIPLPGVFPPPASVTTNPLQVHQAPVISQNSATVVKNYTQPNILDEPIAREIVINDAEPNVRCKLTKRQAQEEIQRATGAVVITRGKYQPPDAFTGSEKPLYLHISAGTHLKDTSQRIIAVDRAAFMVEEILRQGQILLPAASMAQPVVCNGQIPHFLSTSVYLGFEADPSLNVVARIRGPNDQYINHIMNETGAKVVLQGRGSRNFDASTAEEQPLHLHISSANSRSLEAAIKLAENLLDTISAECGASRISSCNVYPAVPPQHPPFNLLPSVAMPHINANSVTLPSSLPNGSMLNYVNPQPHITNYPYPVSNGAPNGAACYNGYGGIYPQATPLQQVALALKCSAAPLTPILTSTSSSVPEKEKQHVHKRKFQELPVADASTNSQNNRGTESRNLSTMPPPKKLLHMELAQLPPPPPKFSESKFDSLAPDSEVANNQDTVPKKLNKEPVPDTVLKLVEYGDEEEEDDDTKGSVEELCKGKLTQKPSLKPFWAV